MLNIVVLVSGGGSNLQSLIDAVEQKKITNGRIVEVISSNPDAYALKRAESHGIKTRIINRKIFSNTDEFCDTIKQALQSAGADLVVLAGFMSILNKSIIDEYRHKIINIHPSLIPAFCGKGFYGLKVHQKAIEYGVKITGATVHFVNEIPDGGEIILQKAVEIRSDDTAESLQLRVMKEAEWDILPRAVDLFCNNKLEINGNKVIIKE